MCMAVAAANLYEGWVQGYMNGLAASQDSDRLKGSDPSAVEKSMDERCRLKPQEPNWRAANSIYERLQ